MWFQNKYWPIATAIFAAYTLSQAIYYKESSRAYCPLSERRLCEVLLGAKKQQPKEPVVIDTTLTVNSTTVVSSSFTAHFEALGFVSSSYPTV